MRRWWIRRRRQRAWRQLEQSLASIDDHQPAALLTVLTARIATLDSGSASDVRAAIELARRVREDYCAYLGRLAPLRDTARAELTAWTHRVEVAAEHGPELVEPARERCAEWERRLRDADIACEDCNAAERRINDALAELTALELRLPSH